DMRTVHVHDVRDDPGYTFFADKEKDERRTMLCAPLLRKGALIGVIVLSREEVRPFSDRQIDLVETFADQGVIAIENARLFEAEQLRTSELQESLEYQTAMADVLNVISRSPSELQPVLDKIVEMAARLCEADMSLLHRKRGDSDGYYPTATFGYSAGVSEIYKSLELRPGRGHSTGRALLEGRPVQILDVLEDSEYTLTEAQQLGGHRTTMAVPLKSNRQTIGVISLSRKNVRAFTPKQIALVETFADQAVIAIENARLFCETQEALEQQSASAEILSVISNSMDDAQPVFDRIAQSALQLFDGVGVGILLVEDQLIQVKAAVGSVNLEAARSMYPMPLDRSSYTGRAILDKSLMNIADTEASGVPDTARELGRRLGYRSNATMPMMRGGVAIGTISVHRVTPGALDEKDLGILRTFADQAVVAIENARLFNETREALERQTATAEILKVIASSPSDVQPVFDSIAESASRIFAPCISGILIREGDTIDLRSMSGATDADEEALRSIYPRQFNQNNLTTAAIKARHVIQLDDTEAPDVPEGTKQVARAVGFRSISVAPLLRGTEGIGAISITSPKAGFTLSEKQVSLLQTFADQAVIAIQNVRLFNETKASLEYQTATSDVLTAIAQSATDSQPVFEAIVTNAARLCDATFSVIVLYDGERMHLGALNNMNEDVSEQQRARYPMPPDRSQISGRAILSGKIVQVTDIQSDPEYPQDLARTGEWRSVMAVPLMNSGTPIGAIFLARSEAVAFSERQVALVSTFARQAVIAIENARLFNETKEALERQTGTADILRVIANSPDDVQPVFDAIAENSNRLIGGFSTTVARLIHNELHLVGFTSTNEIGDAALTQLFPVPVGDYPRSHLLLAGDTVQVTDTETDTDLPSHVRDVARARGFRSMFFCPLLREGKTIGVISVTRQNPGSFSDHHAQLLQTFADQAVIAIENVRLFNETREALEQQTATAEVLEVIASSPSDVQPVFDALAENAVRLCEAERAFVFKFDGEMLRAAASYNAGPEIRAFIDQNPIPPGRHSISARAALERRTIHVHDIQEDPEYTYTTWDAGLVRTLLAVPMLSGDELVGTITIYKLEVKPFTEKQIALVETFSEQAVIAINNAQLFEEVQERTAEVTEALEQQKASAEILSVISNSIEDTQPVFDKILQSCQHLFGGDELDVLLVDEKDMLQVAAYIGESHDIVAATFPAPVEKTPAGQAIRERRVKHWPDLVNGEDVPAVLRRMARLIGYKSMAFAPMLWEGRGIGAIGVARSTGEF
ncbi:MAG: GAF domain-containing protein, partial [Hyphomicrobiaceae bacterium]